jgi:NADH dehydrogenase [ubiquinone] 1 alpha subcomplex assembly factor 3
MTRFNKKILGSCINIFKRNISNNTYINPLLNINKFNINNLDINNVKNINIKSFSSFGKEFDIIQPPRPGEKIRTLVQAFGDTSIKVNDVICRQSIICLSSEFLLWEPRTFEDITIESLSIFELIYPTLEVLFIGCGDIMLNQLPIEIIKHFRSKGIVIEATNTVNAAATFNVLNAEGRNVACALLTNFPVNLQSLQDRIYFSKDSFQK